MGSGKTVVGRALARKLGVGFVDADQRFVAKYGPIAEVFQSEGEARFRELEEQILLECLAEPGVLATGGGVVLSEANRAALKGHTVVWLDVDAASVAPRLRGDRARPLLAGYADPVAAWSVIAEARRPLYSAVALHRTASHGRPPGAVASAVRAAIEASPRTHGGRSFLPGRAHQTPKEEP